MTDRCEIVDGVLIPYCMGVIARSRPHWTDQENIEAFCYCGTESFDAVLQLAIDTGRAKPERIERMIKEVEKLVKSIGGKCRWHCGQL